MFTTTITAAETTITLTGEIAGHAAILAPAVGAVLAGREEIPVVIDCTAVTGIGLDGAGLLFGVVRSLGFTPITIRVAKGPAGRGIALLFDRLNREAINHTGEASVPVVFV